MTFVVVVDFETTSTNHGHALELLDEYIDTFLRVQPGFIESWLSEKQIDRGYCISHAGGTNPISEPLPRRLKNILF